MYSTKKHVLSTDTSQHIGKFHFEGLIETLVSKYKSTQQPELFYQIYKLTYCHVYDYIFELTGSEQQAVYFVQKTYQNFASKIMTFKKEQSLVKWFDEKTIEEMIKCGYQLQLFPHRLSRAV